MRKCVRQIQSTLLPGWFLRSQQVPLIYARSLKNNKKGDFQITGRKRNISLLYGMWTQNVYFLTWLREKLEARRLSIWTFGETFKLGTARWPNFLRHLGKERCRGRSLLFPKRPRNDESGNISFSEATANPSGGWVGRWKENWPWELGTWLTAPACC